MIFVPTPFRGVTGCFSLVGQLKEMNRVMWGGDETHHTLPTTHELAAQYLLLMEGTDDLDETVQDGYRIARISSRVRMEDSMALSGKVAKSRNTSGPTSQTA
jgi:hypothetical protein